APGGALLTLSARQALLLRFGIEPENAALIEPGTLIRFRSVFAAQGAQMARVMRVDGQINPATRLLDVIAKPEASPKSSPEALIAGTTLEGQIALPAQQGLTVPTEAVVLNSGAPLVFKIQSKSVTTPHPMAQAVPVRVRLRVGDATLIEPLVAGALEAGDALVIQGQYALQDGMAVRLVPAS
ncbi:MAG: hypothetical protein B7Y07_09200, partial [Halothiobacillus sp. 24-54-40]